MSRVVAATFSTAALFAAVDVLGVRVSWGPNYVRPIIPRMVGGFLFALPFTFAGLLILGVPCAFILRRLRAESAPSYAIVGAVMGSAWLYFWMRSLEPAALGIGSLLGCACALFWWWFQPKP